MTLQVIATPEEDSISGVLPPAASVSAVPTDWQLLTNYVKNIQLLPALLQTSILALLSTSIPLSQTLTSTLIVVDPYGKLVQDPSAKQIHSASSVHVLAFSSHGDLLLVESEGSFGIDAWEEVVEKASYICHGTEAADSDSHHASVDPTGRLSLESVMKNTMQERTAKEQRWRESLG